MELWFPILSDLLLLTDWQSMSHAFSVAGCFTHS